MQNIRYLTQWLDQYANSKRYLFMLQDLRALFPNISDAAFKTLLSRAVRSGVLARMCRGLYVYKKASHTGLILFHAAARLRAQEFNYISLETALSDLGIISQIPLNWISIMSSGRSNIIKCGIFGTIEFVHTDKKPERIMQELVYDEACQLWRASAALALKDMRDTNRNCDLIDWDAANELI